MSRLPEVNLAKHGLSFGLDSVQELGNKYWFHSPDMPRLSEQPLRTGPDPGKKGKRKMNFRWNLVGKGGASEKRSFWKFDKKVEVPLEIINSFTANPDSTPDRVLVDKCLSER